jgi:hypothetical protein
MEPVGRVVNRTVGDWHVEWITIDRGRRFLKGKRERRHNEPAKVTRTDLE